MTGPPIDLLEWLDRLGFQTDEFVQAGEKLPGGVFRAATGPISALRAVPQDRDMWVGPNPTEHVTTGRPGNDQVTRLAALHVDLDVKPGGCPSFEVAHAIVDTLAGMLGSRPVALTFSGHGLQPVWAIEDGHFAPSTSERFGTFETRGGARALMRRWGRLVAAVAERHSAGVDALWDLTRILRCPGSVNHKDPAHPVPVVTLGDTGAPITVERILETLDEYGIAEEPDDARGIGDVVSEPSEWSFALQTCGYAAAMVRQWEIDTPSSRHTWLTQQTPRLAAAVRYGCFDRAGYALARATLTGRFLALLGGDRKPTPGEVGGALSWGQGLAACMSDNHLASELGYHLHAEPLPAPPDRSNDGHTSPGADAVPTRQPDEHVPPGVAPGPELPAVADGAADGMGAPLADAAVLAQAAPVAEPSAWDQLVEQESRRLRLRDEARELEDRRKAGGITVPAPIRLDAFLSVPDKPVTYRIHGLMPTEARVMLAAQFKAGKTTTVGNLVRSLVDGDKFLSHFDVEPLPAVVVIDDEMSEQQLRRWLRDQDIVRTDAVSVVSLRGRVGSFDILNEAVRSRWATALATVGCGLLVFDCLRPVLDALGLSEDKEAGRFLVAFDALLAEAGISEAVVVHHMGHGGERSRGDSRIRDWPDVEWRLVRDVKPGDEDPAAPRFFSAFGRDVSISEGLVTMDERNRHLTFDSTTSRKEHRKAQDDTSADLGTAIMRHLIANPGASKEDVKRAVSRSAGVGLNRVGEALERMTGRGGCVHREVLPQGGFRHFYVAAVDDDDDDDGPSSRPLRASTHRHSGDDDGALRGTPSSSRQADPFLIDPFGTGLSA